MTQRLLAAAAARAAGVAQLSDRPKSRRWCAEEAAGAGVRARLEVAQVRELMRDGQTVVAVGGYASVTESGYEMYDWYGPYTEVVSRGAFAGTLAAAPLVEFTVNHGAGGALPMAHTRNGTLELSEDDTGLRYDAFVDPGRADVAVMLSALSRGDLAEASFKFRITRGQWSPDYTEYRIDEVDIDRGDVSAVNFGANPAASSTLRSRRAPQLKRALTDQDRDVVLQAMGVLSGICDNAEDVLEALSAITGAAPAVVDPEDQQAASAAAAALATRQARLALLLPEHELVPRRIPGL